MLFKAGLCHMNQCQPYLHVCYPYSFEVTSCSLWVEWSAQFPSNHSALHVICLIRFNEKHINQDIPLDALQLLLIFAFLFCFCCVDFSTNDVPLCLSLALFLSPTYLSHLANTITRHFGITAAHEILCQWLVTDGSGRKL